MAQGFDPWEGTKAFLPIAAQFAQMAQQRQQFDEQMKFAREKEAAANVPDELGRTMKLAQLEKLGLELNSMRREQSLRRKLSGLYPVSPDSEETRPLTIEEQAALATMAGRPDIAKQFTDEMQAQKNLTKEDKRKYTLKDFQEGSFWVPEEPGIPPVKVPGVTPREPKGTQVSVINKINTQGMGELAKKMAGNVAEEYAKARDIKNSYSSLMKQAQLLDSNIFVGPLANVKLKFGRALLAAGIHLNDDAIANTEAYFGAVAKETANIIQDFGAGTGLSDADREFANKAAAGDVTMTKESLRRIIELNKNAKENIVTNYNDVATEIMKKPEAEALPFDIRIDMQKQELPWKQETQRPARNPAATEVNDAVDQYLKGRSWEK